ncbi:MAG: hypothetical protein KGH60_03610 [Candidatus Micrarchaeota archaeon]|nr:hypothetical protein [Candidatus Micrarchaeota archaeon]
MATVEEVVDRFSGMITPGQAKALIDSGNFSKYPQNGGVTNVQALLGFTSMSRVRQAPGLYTLSIQDLVYRVFNPSAGKRRIVVLGGEGSTAKLNLSGKLSELIDDICIERGDTILLKDALLDMALEELRADKDTAISKVASGAWVNCVSDYSCIKDGMKNIDISGRILEIGQVKNVGRIGSENQVPIMECTVTDSVNTAHLSLLESSAHAASMLKPDDFVKIEFCRARVNENRIDIYANSLSRVFANKEIGERLSRKKI